MSQVRTGKPFSLEKVVCPWCKKIGQKGSMARWHFENCKYKGDKNETTQAKYYNTKRS